MIFLLKSFEIRKLIIIFEDKVENLETKLHSIPVIRVFIKFEEVNNKHFVNSFLIQRSEKSVEVRSQNAGEVTKNC
jgi:hypothetical protein